jgi:hypothetical protein
MTDEQFKELVTHLERIERYLSAISGLVFVDEIPTTPHVIDGVVAPARKARLPPNQ